MTSSKEDIMFTYLVTEGRVRGAGSGRREGVKMEGKGGRGRVEVRSKNKTRQRLGGTAGSRRVEIFSEDLCKVIQKEKQAASRKKHEEKGSK